MGNFGSKGIARAVSSELVKVQQAIRTQCFHPAGDFVEFAKQETEQSILNRFAEIVRTHPDWVALKTPSHELTYAELENAANRVALALLEFPEKNGGPVGLLFENGAPLRHRIPRRLIRGAMISYKRLFAGFFVACGISGCHPTRTTSDSDVETSDHAAIAQRVGQLMMVGFKGTELTPGIRKTLRDLQPGGVCLYKQNIISPEQVSKLNEELRLCVAGGIPPFIAVDQEGGTVVRIDKGVTVLPSNMCLGATRSMALAQGAGRVQGRELRLLGFNMNLAPVLDVPDNPAIGTRSFSDQPNLIAELGAAYIKAQQDANIATIAKHFPGEGHSTEDSHDKMPTRREPADVLRAELSPFCDVIQQDLDGLMTAHVALPTLSGDNLPATISPRLLTGVLRDEFGFDGLILTDELEGMRSISAYGVEHAAVTAIKAGADMVFVAFSPETQKSVQAALIEAVRSGDIPAARLDEALKHILILKLKRKIFDAPSPLDERLTELGRNEGSAVATQIARQSLTRLRIDSNSLPLNPNSRVGIISDSKNLVDAIRAWSPHARVLLIDRSDWRQRLVLRQQVQQIAQDSEVIIAGFIASQRLEIARSVGRTGRPLIVILMNVPGPGLSHQIPEARAILTTYSYQPIAVEAAAAAIFGKIEMPGILPVNGGALDPTPAKTAKAQ